MKYIITIVFSLLLWCNQIRAAEAGLNIDRLTCEYIENPLGIETLLPRFSWTMHSSERSQMQSAYEILMSDNLKDIKSLSGNIWQSGKINSSQSLHVVYAGKALRSFKRYYWMLRVYNQDGEASEWSKPAWFETAMLRPADWTAKWISDGSKSFERDEDFYKNDPAPIFKKEFKATSRIVSARLYISGLGYYEAYLNGRKIGDRVLDPGWTAYSKQVLYSVYDVTPYIKNGLNAAGIMLGNGFYNPLPLRLFSKHNIRDAQQTGRPAVKAEFHISYENGEKQIIATDETWETTPGPVLRNSSYLGEHYDARLEVSDWNIATAENVSGKWKKASLTAGPPGILSVQMQPPVRVTKLIKPIGVKEVKPGIFVFDMGQNFAGVAKISVKGKVGARIVLRYGEDVYPDGSLNVMTTVTGQIKRGNGGPGAPKIAWQEDSYTLKGNGREEWSPRFTFHGFRYVEITGWPGKPGLNDVAGLRMNSDLESKGEFSSSNKTFNRLKEIAEYTFLSNVFSVQSDCPAREKLGYGGDMVATAESFMYSFDMSNFYRKTIQDFRNDQRSNGGFTETAPYIGIESLGLGGGTGPLGWQLAYPFLLKQMYGFYGDKNIVIQGYGALKKQVEFIRSKAKDNLFYKDISDHESLDPKPEALTASLFYYHHILLIKEFAGIAGKKSDSAMYSDLAAKIKQAILAKFANSEKGIYDSGTQAAQIFGLWYQLPDEEMKAAALQRLEEAFAAKNWHLSTGIFSTKMMFDVLRENNKNEFAYRIANQRDFPGWGHMIENGATTLWETWKYSDNTYSQNHPMFGSVIEWFYRSLLGINSAKPGFERIIIKPQPAGDLTWAKGSYNSIRGKIGSSWKIADGVFSLDVSIPANTTAEIWVPAEGKAIASAKIKENGVRFLRADTGYMVYEVGSGNYSF